MTMTREGKTPLVADGHTIPPLAAVAKTLIVTV